MNDTHPTSELLSAYATGSCTDGAALAVAAHATYCAACRAEIGRYEALAGAILAESDEPAADGWDEERALGDALTRLEASDAPTEIGEETRKDVDAGPLPYPLAQAIGVDFDAIPWRFRLPGVAEYEFISDAGETVSLLKVRPGAAIPKHTHKAAELTVIVDGELIDGDQRFGPGDVAIADEHVNHHPRAGGDRTCICLAVLSGGLTFTGPFGRALNLFA